MFKLLTEVVKAVKKQELHNYLYQIFAVVREFWRTSSLFSEIMTLIEESAQRLGLEFQIYLPDLIPQFLSVLNSDSSAAAMAAAEASKIESARKGLRTSGVQLVAASLGASVPGLPARGIFPFLYFI